jgi:uncharacterized membrane protein YraQ (UPF0718 family)
MKNIKLLTNILIGVLIVATLGLWLYIYLKDSPKEVKNIVIQSKDIADHEPNKPNIVSDIQSQTNNKQEKIDLNQMAYKTHTKIDFLTILLYILLGILFLLSYKKLLKLWNAIVKNSA